jgi:hypothetical protein
MGTAFKIKTLEEEQRTALTHRLDEHASASVQNEVGVDFVALGQSGENIDSPAERRTASHGQLVSLCFQGCGFMQNQCLLFCQPTKGVHDVLAGILVVLNLFELLDHGNRGLVSRHSRNVPTLLEDVPLLSEESLISCRLPRPSPL